MKKKITIIQKNNNNTNETLDFWNFRKTACWMLAKFVFY